MIHLPRIIIVFAVLFILNCCGVLQAQVTFNIPSPLCAGQTVTVSASTGTFPGTSYQWFSAPSGPSFSSPNTLVTDITFNAAGVYTIMMGAAAGASTSTGAQVVTVNPLPTLTLSSTSPTTCAGQDATLTASGAGSYTWSPLTGLYFYSNSSAYISPYSTVSYTIVGTSSLGCNGSISFTQHVNSYPALLVVPSTSVVCAGFNSTITASGATGYTWTGTTFTGSISQSSVAVGSGSYMVVGGNGGCNDTARVFIGIAPGFTPIVSASRSAICINDGDSLEPVTLIASGALNYTWTPYNPGQMSFSLGATTAVSPTASTCYTVTGSNSNCIGTQIICVNVLACTALEEINDTFVISIFPNPVQDKLLFHTLTAGALTIKITNVAGQLIFEKRIHDSEAREQEISMENFTSGIYFVYINKTGQSSRPVRVIKK